MRSFLSIQYVHADLCKHLGIDSSTDLDDRYSNLFLNAYINRQYPDRYSNLFLNAYINRHVYTFTSVKMLAYLEYLIVNI